MFLKFLKSIILQQRENILLIQYIKRYNFFSSSGGEWGENKKTNKRIKLELPNKLREVENFWDKNHFYYLFWHIKLHSGMDCAEPTREPNKSE